MSQRVKTANRLDIAGATYYLKLQSQNQRSLFSKKQDYQTFLETLSTAARTEDIKILAYCLLSQSVQLVLNRSEQTNKVSAHRFAERLIKDYTEDYNQQHDRNGSVFTSGFACTLIEPATYLADAVALLHRLPVIQGLVAEANIYPWSSHNRYLEADTQHDDWFDPNPALNLITQQRSGRQRRYHNFIAQTTIKNVNWEEGNQPQYAALSCSHYLQKNLQKQLQQTSISSDNSLNLARLTRAVCREYEISPQDLLHQRRHRLVFEVRAQIARIAELWSLASREKTSQFLSCDLETLNNSMRSLCADTTTTCYQLEQKLARKFGISTIIKSLQVKSLDVDSKPLVTADPSSQNSESISTADV